jgi:GTPase Era involved in 16S rRNA processing
MVQVARRKKPSGSARRRAAVSDTFDVLVLATMSAGKSSLINALIGREILPSANEATTACLTSVEHRRSAKYFRGACYSHGGIEIGKQRDASLENVRAWNTDAQVKHIRLAGKFRGHPAPPSKLVLHDTPGPNNSQNDGHAAMMSEAVRTVPFNVLCYILDSSQLGTWDDRRLLEQLRELLAPRSGHSIVFILNKVDLLDPERGEDITGCISSATKYLEDLGFHRPIIVPTMASVALYARKAMNAEPLTRVERNKLRMSLDELSAGMMPTLNAAAIPAEIRKRALDALKPRKQAGRTPSADIHELEQLLVHSGIRTVEFLLNQYSGAK